MACKNGSCKRCDVLVAPPGGYVRISSAGTACVVVACVAFVFGCGVGLFANALISVVYAFLV